MENVIVREIKTRIAHSAQDEFSNDNLIDAFVLIDEYYHGYLSVLFSPLYQAHFNTKMKHTLAPVFAQATGCHLSHPRVAALMDMFFSGIMSNVAHFVMGDNGLNQKEVVLLNRSLLTEWLIPQLKKS